MNAPEMAWMTSIRVNEVRNLKDFQIDICSPSEMRHLILTGPNGSGKTSLLSALLDHLTALAEDAGLQFRTLDENLRTWNSILKSATEKNDAHKIQQANINIKNLENSIKRFWGAVRPSYTDENQIPLLFTKKQFVISYYGDFRQSKFVAPVNPEKPRLEYRIKDNKVQEFLKFLVDLKVQQALAKNENNENDASEIELWFDVFVGILRRIFKDESLQLHFDYRDYSFLIGTQGKSFPFTGLSAGYSAALDIVADLILKMQTHNRCVRVFDMPGIVLIDEIETHLHLALQKEILPLLTSIFPRVQFIVTTHSPFVLNSVKNAVVFDLVSRKPVQDLTEYSYESLTEGFFGVETESGELRRRLDRMAEILKIGITESSRIELDDLMKDFSNIPDAVAPSQKARFNAIRNKYLVSGGIKA